MNQPGGEPSTSHPAVLPPRGMLAAFALQIPLAALSWPWRPSLARTLASTLCLAAGSVLNLWSHRRLTAREVEICPFGPVPRLVEDGPYRLSRNPMYLGMVLLVAGTGFLAGYPWNLWTAAAYAAWLHVRFILPEERYLAGLFGDAYTTYAQRRGRWIGWRWAPKRA